MFLSQRINPVLQRFLEWNPIPSDSCKKCIVAFVRAHSSHEWLERQRKDPYVKKAKYESYRARSAFKLLEMDAKYRIFRPGQTVVDLGAAPGSWCQVTVKAVNVVTPSEVATSGILPRMVVRDKDRTEFYYEGEPDDLLREALTKPKAKHQAKNGLVIGVDLLPINPLPGAIFLQECDFTKPKTQQAVQDLLKGEEVDVVLSDMAPNASGMREMDHDLIIHLCRTALQFALKVLAENGVFLCKVWDGRQLTDFVAELKQYFKMVRNVKPPASRDDSSEKYVLATGFQKSLLLANKTAAT
ncbi:rRNA methyltransferase 2, mitochondrial-like [Paramacrobiotus metropolitanus]|uniref:rRNA methyltransferase 2, mitochondrial-like n=1 Tax=Paramacrobiotus metropolitanus TaxID=2943436 RepID=UPI002445A4EB|nr:rRNA methyltransferase 2, mitochondrial-like [Paramacrobiotus metropolitanus]